MLPTLLLRILILSLLLLLPASLWAAEIKSDVRVLIDISGSMKKNDPQNLRQPALRLMVGLLPPDTKAGVWTFAQYVNMLVPLAPVDDKWKKKARASASTIRWPGQFTNIEGVLKKATKNWSGKPKGYQRHVVLLTDGMVDISRDDAVNQKSRQRIIDEVLPRLKELEIKVHTIALSERADHQLMKELAHGTGGWYEQINDSERLQRVFLRMFEKVGKPDAIPLSENKFEIDKSIKEATLLVFNKGDKKTELVKPGGKAFSEKTKPSNVSWFKDEGFELITIKKPQPGKWRIRADIDPDNRVMIVTDLKMLVSDVPNTLIAGEQIDLFSEFQNKGKRIVAKTFLDLLKVDLMNAPLGIKGKPKPVLDDGITPDEKEGDGIFSATIIPVTEPGLFEVVVAAEANTFKREKRQTVNVLEPAAVNLNLSKSPAIARLVLQSTLIDTNSVDISAVLTPAGGAAQTLAFKKVSDDSYETTLALDSFSGVASLQVSLSTSSKQGKVIDWEYRKQGIQGTAPLPPVKAPEKPVEPVPEITEELTEETDWVWLGTVLGIGNVVLFLILGLIWWLMRRNKDKNEVDLLAGLADESLADIEQSKTTGTSGAIENGLE